jgi:hypothetical protein
LCVCGCVCVYAHVWVRARVRACPHAPMRPCSVRVRCVWRTRDIYEHAWVVWERAGKKRKEASERMEAVGEKKVGKVEGGAG